LYSVHGAVPDNSSAVAPCQQPSSLIADTVLYAFDATTYRHALQDVKSCKTALLRMKQLLQKVVILNFVEKKHICFYAFAVD